MTDSTIIEKYLNGDKKVLPLLVKRWHQTFCEKAYWIVKDPDVAKDIAQESWVVIINKLHTLQQPSKFKYWALKIVYSKSIDLLHRTNLEKQKSLEWATASEKSSDNVDDELPEHKQRLLQAIYQLSIEKQHVIRLFYLEQHSVKEIGEILEISTGTVKSRLFNAREELKQIIKK
ncbi:MAG: RNA polymerase sigma factor [Nonlabens sp.]|uniref:RNA polymerase sigma factor n=1 Tax=Nonlabens sp. TaxID=1888209 RepID=UPI003EF68FE0